YEHAYAERCVSVEPAGDGMAWVTAFLRADQALQVRASLDTVADRVRARTTRDDDGRTLDHIRADALVDLIVNSGASAMGGGVDGGLPATGTPPSATSAAGRPAGRGVAVSVTIGAGTLLGLDDQPAE